MDLNDGEHETNANLEHTDQSHDDRPLPYLTADLAGIGGRLKQELGDFEVEEIPAYVPCGSGEHLFLWIEKTGITTDQLTRHLVRTLSVAHRDIGVAALKDKHAVARQFVSVPAKSAANLSAAESPEVRVLNATLHQNKLRTGHLRGNRFSILLRDVPADALPLANQVASQLEQLGVPNYFGEQRFGSEGETSDLGFALLRGETVPEDIHPSRRRFLVKLALSAAQSVLFNELLAERVQSHELQRVNVGDVLQVVSSGGVFVCEDQATDQARFDAREVVPAGPMFGPKMKQAVGEVAEREARMLSRYQLTLDQFRLYPDLTSGTRRPYVIFVEELCVTAEAEGLRFQFSLPSGCYATVLMREFQKSDSQ